MKSKEDISKDFERHFKITRSGCMKQWEHIRECQRFYSGDYMNYRDNFTVGRGASSRIKEVQFNRVKPYVNSIVGFMAQQRRKPDYQARIGQPDEQRALTDYLNGFSDYCRENTNADQMETRQDKDLIVGGIGVTDTAITVKQGAATRDPNGEIITERVDPITVGWDPDAVHPNLTDARWVYRAKDYDVEEAEELFGAEEEDFETAEEDLTDYQFNPFGGIQDKIGYEWADSERKMVRVYFYQWYEIESFYRIENPILQNPALFEPLSIALSTVDDEEDSMFRFNPGAQILVITKDKRKAVKDIFEAFGLKFDPLSEKRRVYFTAIISGKKVFQRYKSIDQQGFTLKFKTGDYDDANRIWTGVVASMRDPQRYYNKSLTELMLIIASNSRGGVIYETDAVDNVQQFEAKWAKTNAAVGVNPGALQNNKIREKAMPHLNTGYEGLIQTSGDALSKVTGIDESFFGAIAGGNETAMLQRQRIKQATTTLACYIDSVTLYQKEQARLMLSFMRLLAENSAGQMFKASDDNGDQIFEYISTDFFADEYDITVGEAPETSVQKDYYTQTLIQMAQSMQAIGDPRYLQMYAAAVKYMPIPQRDKNNITQILEAQEQVNPQLVVQLQQQIEALTSKQAQVQQNKVIADTQKVLAEIQKTQADIRKTKAETDNTIEDTEQKAIENDLMDKEVYETKVTI